MRCSTRVSIVVSNFAITPWNVLLLIHLQTLCLKNSNSVVILLRHFRFFKLIFYMLSANSILIPAALSSSHFTSHDGAILGCRRDLHKTVQDLRLWQQYIEQRCHVTKCKLEMANQGLFLKSKFKKEFFNCLWLINIVVSW